MFFSDYNPQKDVLLGVIIAAIMIDRYIVNTYFWRTKQGQEIDYLEESNGRIEAFEIKWNFKRKPLAPSAFAAAYSEYDFAGITPDNFTSFLTLPVQAVH